MSNGSANGRGKRFVLGHYPGLNLWTLFFFVYLYMPMVVLVAYAFNDGNRAQIWQGFSTRWFYRAFINDDIQTAALNTLIIAVCATAVATVIATLAALALTRGGEFRGRGVSLGLIALPLVVPEIATAVATLSFFAIIGFQLGLLSIIIAHTVLTAPFAMAIIRLRLSQMDASLEAAAWNLGADQWRALRLVIIPFCKPAIISSFCLTAAVSFDEFAIAWFISGLNKTIPVVILEIVTGNIDPQVNAIGSFVFLTSMTLVIIAQVVLMTKEKKEKDHHG